MDHDLKHRIESAADRPTLANAAEAAHNDYRARQRQILRHIALGILGVGLVTAIGFGEEITQTLCHHHQATTAPRR